MDLATDLADAPTPWRATHGSHRITTKTCVCASVWGWVCVCVSPPPLVCSLGRHRPPAWEGRGGVRGHASRLAAVRGRGLRHALLLQRGDGRHGVGDPPLVRDDAPAPCAVHATVTHCCVLIVKPLVVVAKPRRRLTLTRRARRRPSSRPRARSLAGARRATSSGRRARSTARSATTASSGSTTTAPGSARASARGTTELSSRSSRSRYRRRRRYPARDLHKSSHHILHHSTMNECNPTCDAHEALTTSCATSARATCVPCRTAWLVRATVWRVRIAPRRRLARSVADDRTRRRARISPLRLFRRRLRDGTAAAPPRPTTAPRVIVPRRASRQPRLCSSACSRRSSTRAR